MLQKVLSIKNVGRFYCTVASGDVTFRRLTLVFAENGRGKTTFCAILRSLAANSPGLIQGRATLGSGDPPDVQLLCRAGAMTFRNGAWSAPFPDIAIHDGTYVSENVFAGEVVETQNRRNLYRVIIGAQGVTLVGRLNDLDNQVRTKNTDIRNLRQSLQGYVPANMTVDAFIALPGDEVVDEKIAAREQELEAVRRAVELQQRQSLVPIAALAFPAAFAEVLAKTLEDVAADAERRVTNHIRYHRMQERGEAWLTEGLGYVTDDSCPFCEQPLAGNDLLPAYSAFFEDVKELVETIISDSWSFPALRP